MPVRASSKTSISDLSLVGLALEASASSAKYNGDEPRNQSVVIYSRDGNVSASAATPHSKFLTSDQVGIPAELKHINKRRKRNQQGLP
jgi:hypothetical protein